MAISQNLNECSIEGKVISIDHTLAIVNGKDAIYGTVTVEAGEDNFVPIGFFSYKTKNDGGENNVYKSLLSVIDDYKTIANDGRDAADSVVINKVELSENVFFGQDGKMIRGFQLSSSFYNRGIVKEAGAKFTVTGEIFEMIEEIVDDVPTGALILRLLVLGYKGRPNIIDFNVVDSKGVNYLKTVATVGQDLKVSGDILVIESVEEKTEESAFGAPIVTSKRTTSRQLVVKSATPPSTGLLTDEERSQVLAVREGIVLKAKEKANKKAATTTTSKPSSGNFTL